jgi:ketosteroid isomerase-like protein
MPSSAASETDRPNIERLLGELYAARASGDLDRLCGLFAPDAVFKIAGSNDGKPIAIAASGAREIRTWLSVLVKSFRITRYEIASMVIDSPRAAVQWQASIDSRITGASVTTELVDIVETRDGRISSYVELFVPA